MKLKGKLIMSAAALAACAATLTSTTYAWYTSNTEVSASGVEGTSQANGEGMLLISTSGAYGSFSNKASVEIKSDNLIPVQYTAGTDHAAPTFNAWDASTNKPSETALNISSNSNNQSVLAFDLYFTGVKEDVGVDVYLKSLTVTRNAGALPEKVIYGEGDGLKKPTAQGNTYTANILRTVKMAYVSSVTTEGNQAANSSSGCYDLETGDALNTTKFSYGDTLADLTSGFNAHTYYNNVLTGSNIPVTGDDVKVAGDAITNSTSVNFGTTPNSTTNGNYVKATFYFFIDGWDIACFDAVQQQSFKVEMEFTSTEDTKLAVKFAQATASSN